MNDYIAIGAMGHLNKSEMKLRVGSCDDVREILCPHTVPQTNAAAFLSTASFWVGTKSSLM